MIDVGLRDRPLARSPGVVTPERSSSWSWKQEFAGRGYQATHYGITGWVIFTLVQHATEDQVARWVRPALRPGA